MQPPANMMTLGLLNILWACLVGSVAVAAIMAAVFLWVRRNGGWVTHGLCAMLCATALLLGETAVVLILVATKRGMISRAGYIMFHVGQVPVMLVVLVFVIWIIRAKELRIG